GRSAAEVQAIVAAARTADRLLGVDLSYRHVEGLLKIRELLRTQTLGEVFAVDLVFHNAYGPQKPWFYDRSLSGGGCVIDLGIHLVDLALWTLASPPITHVSSTLFAKGRPLTDGEVEDYAIATLRLNCDVAVRIACSWNLPAGCD